MSDYLLGVSDLTGELMRFAISSISKRGPGRSKASEVSSFVRGCKAGEPAHSSCDRGRTPCIRSLVWTDRFGADFDGFTPHVRELSKKQHVTQQSLLKIEQGQSAPCSPLSTHPISAIRLALVSSDPLS